MLQASEKSVLNRLIAFKATEHDEYENVNCKPDIRGQDFIFSKLQDAGIHTAFKRSQDRTVFVLDNEVQVFEEKLYNVPVVGSNGRDVPFNGRETAIQITHSHHKV